MEGVELAFGVVTGLPDPATPSVGVVGATAEPVLFVVEPGPGTGEEGFPATPSVGVIGAVSIAGVLLIAFLFFDVIFFDDIFFLVPSIRLAGALGRPDSVRVGDWANATVEPRKAASAIKRVLLIS